MSDERELDDSDFGLPGIEKAAGYTPLVTQTPVDVPEPDLQESDPSYRHLTRRDDSQDAIERDYFDGSGERRPEREVISPEQAAADLARTRTAEFEALEAEGNKQLSAALDGQAPEQKPEPESIEPQPEHAPEPASAERASWDPVDQKIGQILDSDPAVAERIRSSYAQIVQELQAHVEQVRQVYAAATNQLSREIEIVTSALIPEIVGMSPEQAARGALAVVAKQDPARMQQIINFANRVQGAVNLTQQQAHAQQQANQQQFATYQQQAAENFKQYAEQQDAKALAGETPESMAQIRKTILADAKAAGVSEKELYEAYNTVPALRHSFVQGLMADGAKCRAAQRSITQSKANPVPRVQRPGVAADSPRVHEGDLAAAASRFNLPGGNVGTQGLRNAAAWVTAKRGGR